VTSTMTPESNRTGTNGRLPDEPKVAPVSTEPGTRAEPVREGPPALLIEHATKRFIVGKKRRPVVAISDVSLRIERGAIHGVLGANGSGKSTLIRLISGLLTLDEGRVEVFGHDIVREEMAVKRLINRVSVDAAFFKKLSPSENLSFAARLYGMDAKAAAQRAVEILARLGIGQKRMGRPIEQMSRGMQQKVAIARALLTSPILLLLDEPTTGLDLNEVVRLSGVLAGIREAGTTILVVAHDVGFVMRACDYVYVLAEGKLLFHGEPAAVQSHPAVVEAYIGRSA